jgi:hypothetical protein
MSVASGEPNGSSSTFTHHNQEVLNGQTSMSRANTELLRMMLMSSLGLCSFACTEPAAGPSACGDSRAEEQDGVRSGLHRCESGMRHRPEPVSCPNRLTPVEDEGRPAADAGAEAEAEAGVSDEYENCTSSADCTREPYGFCGTRYNVPDVCIYGCTSDADCNPNQICICGPKIGTCSDTTCTSDADCEEGRLCSHYVDSIGIDCNEPLQFACQSPADECAVDSDCGSDPSDNCTAISGTRVCKSTAGICGRPFIVNSQPRLAEVTARADWARAKTVPEVHNLTISQRKRLAKAWAEIGLMEHASVAAFARFALQLLNLGAPAQLVQACNAALGDEIRHAQIAFALASAYRGEPVGPGPLRMDAVLGEHSLGEIVSLVLAEGCVGETVAALEASEALAHCQDETIAAVLADIAREESEHAALAWRFVSWALQREPSLAGRVREQLAELERELEQPPVVSSDFDFDPLPYGVVSAEARASVRRSALREIVSPCARALLAQHGVPRPLPLHAA